MIPFHNKILYLFTWIFLAVISAVFSSTPALSQEVKQIEILNSDNMEYDETLGSNAIKYIGNVIFQQEEAIMYCDSAYFYPDSNYVNAYGSIHIIQGDTLHLYGDYLNYIGNIKLAEVRENVVLIDKENVLHTEFLDFNLEDNVGYYFNGGKIENGDNVLTSMIGYYYARQKLFHYRDSVVIINPEYTIYSDMLKYNTLTEISYFLGPTEIISEENYIYCENGWYDTRKNISQFNKNAYLVSEGQFLKGDSLYYERDSGLGLAFDNVELFDSAQSMILKGRYAIYVEDPEYAMLTDSAVLIQFDEEDTLYVHADTLESILDTTGTSKILKAYYKVKMFRYDMQGKCDSLVYVEIDSVFQLYDEPILWSDENQLTAEHIDIYMSDRKLDYIDLITSSFIVSQEDTIRYNQIKGRNMKGYFTNNKLSRIVVKGNGQTIYFPKDREDLIGINRAESTDLIIYLKESKIERINLILQPDATLYPVDGLQGNEMYLKGFIWLNEYRPLTKEDIFVWKRE